MNLWFVQTIVSLGKAFAKEASFNWATFCITGLLLTYFFNPNKMFGSTQTNHKHDVWVNPNLTNFDKQVNYRLQSQNFMDMLD